MVLRGYLTREANADDRRRMTIDVTERGRAAAAAIKAGVGAVDAELATLITPEQLAGLRAGLGPCARSASGSRTSTAPSTSTEPYVRRGADVAA